MKYLVNIIRLKIHVVYFLLNRLKHSFHTISIERLMISANLHFPMKIYAEKCFPKLTIRSPFIRSNKIIEINTIIFIISITQLSHIICIRKFKSFSFNFFSRQILKWNENVLNVRNTRIHEYFSGIPAIHTLK